MKISELINELARLSSLHGDLEVVTSDCCPGEEPDPYFNHFDGRLWLG